MAKAPVPNVFALAKAKPAAASKPKSQVIVADSVVNPDGTSRFVKTAVVAAIEGFCEGHSKASEAKALMDTNRPIVSAFGLQEFTREWVSLKRLPENPKVTTDPNGAGPLIGLSFTDRQMNLNADEFAEMSNLLGADVAQTLVEDRNEFKLDSETLEKTVDVKDAKGKVVQKSVMDVVADALGTAFADHPDILATLMELKPVFRTQEGLIHKGLQLVGTPSDGATSYRLQQFLKVIKTPIALKPGGGYSK